MPILYTVNVNSTGSQTRVDVSPASSGGYIDILNNFNWTTGGYVDEVPYIIAKEMELEFGQIIQNLAGYLDAINNATGNVAKINSSGNNNTDPNDPYAKLYAAHDTGFTYVFPHLIKNGSSIKGATANTWKRNNIGSLVGGLAKGAVDTAAGLFGEGVERGVSELTNYVGKFFGNELVGSGIGLEDIVTYSATAPRSIKITFPLYNTDSEQSAIRNFDFVNLFGLQNLKMRTSFGTFIPPKIYTVESPGQGGIYMPAAFVSHYDVQSIGTTRFMNTGQYSAAAGTSNNSTNGRIIPEAYRVEITFQEIIPPSSNIMWGSLGGNKVSVINNTTFNNNTVTPNDAKAINLNTGGGEGTRVA